MRVYDSTEYFVVDDTMVMINYIGDCRRFAKLAVCKYIAILRSIGPVVNLQLSCQE